MKRKKKVSLRVVCAVGTLAHNRDFTARDLREYSGGDVNVLVRRGVVEKVSRGRFYPTAKGWDIIERSCRMKYR